MEKGYEGESRNKGRRRKNGGSLLDRRENDKRRGRRVETMARGIFTRARCALFRSGTRHLYSRARVRHGNSRYCPSLREEPMLLLSAIADRVHVRGSYKFPGRGEHPLSGKSPFSASPFDRVSRGNWLV